MLDLLVRFLSELATIMSELAGWLFLGALLAGLLKVFLPENFVRRHVGASSLGSVLKSVVLGVPLPLCSCGVIPTAIGLHKAGASRGASVGFLISTPQTGLDSILVTSSFLGWPLALFKVAAAAVTGLAGGMAANLLRPGLPAPGRDRIEAAPAPTAGAAAPATVSQPWWRRVYDYAFHELIGGIYRYLAVGILLAALIGTLVPSDTLGSFPALQGAWGMVLMLAISIPIYVCSTGSVPIAASLIHAGLPLGSAMVFLMAGPATNAATIGAVYKTFGRGTTALYLGVIITGSVLFGLLFQAWFGGQSWLPGAHAHALPVWRRILDGVAGTLLALALLRWAWLDLRHAWRERHRRTRVRAAKESVQLAVEGMTCDNCARHVREALETVPGVVLAEVDCGTGRARVLGNHLRGDSLAEAVSRAGYRVRSRA